MTMTAGQPADPEEFSTVESTRERLQRWPQDCDGTAWVGDVACRSLREAERFHRARQDMALRHERIIAAERELERRQARLVRMRAELAALGAECAEARTGPPGRVSDEEHRLLTSALAVELTRSTRSLATQVNHATSLASRLPAVLTAWEDGRLHRGQVHVIDRHADTLTVEQCSEYEQEILAVASDLTPAQLGRRAVRIARRLHPGLAADRVAKAHEKRGVWASPDDDGTSVLSIRGNSVLIEGALDRLRRGAAARHKDDQRTVPQWMSDGALVQLICGTEPLGLLDGIQAHVSITMPAPLLTGAGLDGTGYRHGAAGGQAELPSGQLVDDATARLLAGGATSWTRLFTDPVSGVAWASDQYTPSAGLRRTVNARDQTCRFPGCAQPASRCDTDHTIGFEYTRRTQFDDLAALCPSHHALKHILGPHEGWMVKQSSPGILEWTSPAGKSFSVFPEEMPTAVLRAVDEVPF